MYWDKACQIGPAAFEGHHRVRRQEKPHNQDDGEDDGDTAEVAFDTRIAKTAELPDGERG